MVKKTLFVAFVFFVSYAIFVQFFAPTWWCASQNLWQENLVKAQAYIYNKDFSKKNIIIGSSLSERIVMDSLPHTINLAFGGLGVHDGLNILLHKEDLPSVILIEMNYVLRAENSEFNAVINNPFLELPRKNIVALREEKQPVAIFGKLLNEIKLRLQNKSRSIDENSSLGEDVFSKLLQNQVVEYSEVPDSLFVEKTFENMKSILQFFESKGVKIVFFELPTNPELEQLPRAVAIRTKFYQVFPTNRYFYVNLNSEMIFKTTDGVHLSRSESIVYTEYFKSQLTHINL